ncbi:hypothetical protein JCM6882_009424 [Rhodosporidiobolus microsporus]
MQPPPSAPSRQPTPSTSSSSRDSSFPSTKLNPASAAFSFLQPDSVPSYHPAYHQYDGAYPLGGPQQQGGSYPPPPPPPPPANHLAYQHQGYYPISSVNSNYGGGATGAGGWASGKGGPGGGAPWAGNSSPYPIQQHHGHHQQQQHHQQHHPHASHQVSQQQSPYFASHPPPPPPSATRIPPPAVPPGGGGANGSNGAATVVNGNGGGGGIFLPLAHNGPHHLAAAVAAAAGYPPTGGAATYVPHHAQQQQQAHPHSLHHHHSHSSLSGQPPQQAGPLLPPFSPSPVPTPGVLPHRPSSTAAPQLIPAPSLPVSPAAPLPPPASAAPSFVPLVSVASSIASPPPPTDASASAAAAPSSSSAAAFSPPTSFHSSTFGTSAPAPTVGPSSSSSPSTAPLPPPPHGRPLRRRRSLLPPPREAPPVSIAAGLRVPGSLQLPVAAVRRKGEKGKGKEGGVGKQEIVTAKDEKVEGKKEKVEAKVEKPAPAPAAPAQVNGTSKAPSPPSEPATPKQPARPTTAAAPSPAPTPATPASGPAPALPSVPSTPKSPAAAPAAAPTPAAAKPAFKSWADLVRPAAGSAPQTLPNGMIAVSASTSSSPYASTSSGPQTLSNLLSAPPPHLHQPHTPTARGLVNNGNLCFANAILQVLVWTGSFWNLVERVERGSRKDLKEEMAAAAAMKGAEKGKGGEKEKSVVEALIAFFAEFRNAAPSASSTAPAFDPAQNHTSSASASFSSIPSGSSTPAKPPFDNSTHPLPSASSSSSSTPAPPPLSPTPIHDALRPNPRFDAMRRGTQEDAEEFLGFFLETLHEEVLALLEREENKGKGKAKEQGEEGAVDGWEEVGSKGRAVSTRTTEQKESPITRIFGGKLRSILRCPGQKDSVTIEPFQRLGLDIQPDHVTTISDAILQLTHLEILPDYSTSRGLKTEATKQVLLDSLPPVLILHLKRFLYDEGGTQKSTKRVGYGTTLEVDEQVMSSPLKAQVGPGGAKYELFGVVYHHGLHASGGHYTVAVRCGYHSSTWIELDDTNIYPLAESDVAVSISGGSGGSKGGRRGWENAASIGVGDGDEQKNAYLLLYARVQDGGPAAAAAKR